MDILFWILVFTFAVSVLYLLAAGRMMSGRVPAIKRDIPVSIIICAYNELEKLKENLPLVLDQDIDKMEVILVDHGSTDGTADWLRSFHHERLRAHHVPRAQEGKKFALREGIRMARHHALLLTDADCRPVSRDWAAGMAAGFGEGKEIVLGYGMYEHRPGWLNRFVRMETIDTAIRYFTFARIGIPYMGVGRNLAYSKELFMASDQFSGHEHLAGGDDDLFVNEYAHGKNTSIVFDHASATISTPPALWSEWVRQKQRHVTTGPMYRGVHKFLLGLLAVSHYMFYVCFALLMVNSWEPLLVLSLFVERYVLLWIVYMGAMRMWQEKSLGWFVIIFDMVYPLIQLRWILSMGKRNKTSWN